MKKNTRFNQKELATFRKLINKKLAKKQKEYKSLNKSLKRHEKYMASLQGGYKKDALQIRNREMLKRMRNRAKRKITRLEDALLRVAKGTYGFCKKTNKPISKMRLLTMPEATTRIRK